jgi:hypothetical protein
MAAVPRADGRVVGSGLKAQGPFVIMNGDVIARSANPSGNEAGGHWSKDNRPTARSSEARRMSGQLCLGPVEVA